MDYIQMGRIRRPTNELLQTMAYSILFYGFIKLSV